MLTLKRKWVGAPSKSKLLILIVLIIISTTFYGERSQDNCTRKYYGFPAEIYHTDYCSNNFYIDIIGLIMNIVLWTPVAFILGAVISKIRQGK
jgi:hypothetical protein